MGLQVIQNKIYGGQRVMLDFNLAVLYDTETKRLHSSHQLSHPIPELVTTCGVSTGHQLSKRSK